MIRTVSHFFKVYKLCKVTIKKSVKLLIFRIEFEKTVMFFFILDAFGYLMDFCYKKRVMAYGKTYWHNKMSSVTIPVLFFFSKIGSPCLAPRNIFILFQFSVSYCPMMRSSQYVVTGLVINFFLGVRFRTFVSDFVLDVVVKFVIAA